MSAPMPYAEYVVSVRPQLERIEWFSQRVKNFVGLLPMRPAFLTNAEDAMDDAEKALVAALENLRAARKDYKSLPMDGHNA